MREISDMADSGTAGLPVSQIYQCLCHDAREIFPFLSDIRLARGVAGIPDGLTVVHGSGR